MLLKHEVNMLYHLSFYWNNLILPQNDQHLPWKSNLEKLQKEVQKWRHSLQDLHHPCHSLKKTLHQNQKLPPHCKSNLIKLITRGQPSKKEKTQSSRNNFFSTFLNNKPVSNMEPENHHSKIQNKMKRSREKQTRRRRDVGGQEFLMSYERTPL